MIDLSDTWKSIYGVRSVLWHVKGRHTGDSSNESRLRCVQRQPQRARSESIAVQKMKVVLMR